MRVRCTSTQTTRTLSNEVVVQDRLPGHVVNNLACTPDKGTFRWNHDGYTTLSVRLQCLNRLGSYAVGNARSCHVV